MKSLKDIKLFQGKVKRKEIVTFTRELSILNKAGLSLVRCLNSLRDQMPQGRFRLPDPDGALSARRSDAEMIGSRRAAPQGHLIVAHNLVGCRRELKVSVVILTAY